MATMSCLSYFSHLSLAISLSSIPSPSFLLHRSQVKSVVGWSLVAGEGIVWADELMVRFEALLRVGGEASEGLVWVALCVAAGGRGLTFGLKGVVTQPC